MRTIKKTETIYRMEFDFPGMPGCGFTFPCNEKGELLPIKTKDGLEHYEKCINGTYNVIPLGVKTYEHHWEEDVDMKHQAVRVDNLMYKGCEPHWKCIFCGECVPFHCWSKEEFELQNCK